MKTPVRLGLYAAGLALVFAGAFAAAGAAVPQSAVDEWRQNVEQQDTDHGENPTPAESPAATHPAGDGH